MAFLFWQFKDTHSWQISNCAIGFVKGETSVYSTPLQRTDGVTRWGFFILFQARSRQNGPLLQIRARGDLPQKVLCAIPPRSVKAPGPQGAGLPPPQRRQRHPAPLLDFEEAELRCLCWYFIPFLQPGSAKPALLKIGGHGHPVQKVLWGHRVFPVRGSGRRREHRPPSQSRQGPPVVPANFQQRLPVIPYERSEAPSGARRSVSEMRSIEAAEPPAGKRSGGRMPPS